MSKMKLCLKIQLNKNIWLSWEKENISKTYIQNISSTQVVRNENYNGNHTALHLHEMFLTDEVRNCIRLVIKTIITITTLITNHNSYKLYENRDWKKTG